MRKESISNRSLLTFLTLICVLCALLANQPAWAKTVSVEGSPLQATAMCLCLGASPSFAYRYGEASVAYSNLNKYYESDLLQISLDSIFQISVWGPGGDSAIQGQVMVTANGGDGRPAYVAHVSKSSGYYKDAKFEVMLSFENIPYMRITNISDPHPNTGPANVAAIGIGIRDPGAANQIKGEVMGAEYSSTAAIPTIYKALSQEVVAPKEFKGQGKGISRRAETYPVNDRGYATVNENGEAKLSEPLVWSAGDVLLSGPGRDAHSVSLHATDGNGDEIYSVQAPHASGALATASLVSNKTGFYITGVGKSSESNVVGYTLFAARNAPVEGSGLFTIEWKKDLEPCAEGSSKGCASLFAGMAFTSYIVMTLDTTSCPTNSGYGFVIARAGNNGLDADDDGNYFEVVHSTGVLSGVTGVISNATFALEVSSSSCGKLHARGIY
eukprot:Nk52_evm11s2402 gene=Nk52_evmTU11s2402